MPKRLWIVMLMLSLTACLDMNDLFSDNSRTDPRALESGQPWRLIALSGQSSPGDSPITLSFSREGRVSGNGGCNNFFGIFNAKPNGELSIGRVSSTRKLCPDASELEARFFENLEGISGFVIEGRRLRLFGFAGNMEFEAQ